MLLNIVWITKHEIIKVLNLCMCMQIINLLLNNKDCTGGPINFVYIRSSEVDIHLLKSLKYLPSNYSCWAY